MKNETPLNILIIEDDADIFILLKFTLDGHNLTHCFSAEEALKIPSYDLFDIILLDVTLPMMDGFTFFKNEKECGRLKDTPVIFLTAKSNSQDVVEGLKLGAEDYIKKPFHRDELLQRIKLRSRQPNSVASKASKGDLELDIVQRKASITNSLGSEEVHLTNVEFNILLALIETNEKTISRDELIQSVWGKNVNVVPRVVDAHLSNVRKKIEKSNLQIKSIYGKGYCLIDKVKYTGTKNVS